jgi:predicted PurR-regulated permease PerM
MLEKSKFSQLFILGSVTIIIFILSVFNWQYRTPLITGFIFGVLTYPLLSNILKLIENALLKYNLKHKWKIQIDFRPYVALGVIIITTIALFILLSIISSRIVDEVPSFIQASDRLLNQLQKNQYLIDILNILGLSQNSINNLQSNLQNIGRSWVSVDNLANAWDFGQQILNLVFSQVIYLILFLISWYNSLVYGSSWIDGILHLLPFTKSEEKQIKAALTLGIRNVLYANLISGVLNATAVFILMLIFSLPNAFIVAVAVFWIGFLPVTPSELGYLIPVSLIFSQNSFVAIIIFILAELFILWQNYIFLPSIVLTGNKGNPLFIITSVLTGMAIFGIMGFIIGPVIMIFVSTLASIVQNRTEQIKAALQEI